MKARLEARRSEPALCSSGTLWKLAGVGILVIAVIAVAVAVTVSGAGENGGAAPEFEASAFSNGTSLNLVVRESDVFDPTTFVTEIQRIVANTSAATANVDEGDIFIVGLPVQTSDVGVSLNNITKLPTAVKVTLQLGFQDFDTGFAFVTALRA